jgi:hypothetical protein
MGSWPCNAGCKPSSLSRSGPWLNPTAGSARSTKRQLQERGARCVHGCHA